LNEKDWLLVPENEISWGPSCYLWDYLKRSGAMGYFLPLSGGADSAATALIVYNMCKIVYDSITKSGDQKVLKHLREIVREPEFTPKNAQEICERVLFTTYMATDNSSQETRDRAELLAKEINCRHYNVNISEICKKYESLAGEVFQKPIRYQSQGGSFSEDLQLQNIQARSRMILAYLMAGLIPENIKKKGFLLVLGSANLDEGLRGKPKIKNLTTSSYKFFKKILLKKGYMTKYDCSSADVNPIGSISKMDLKKFLEWNAS
jgi:NAD+ synthase (glutamine-hydrolysing)